VLTFDLLEDDSFSSFKVEFFWNLSLSLLQALLWVFVSVTVVCVFLGLPFFGDVNSCTSWKKEKNKKNKINKYYCGAGKNAYKTQNSVLAQTGT